MWYRIRRKGEEKGEASRWELQRTYDGWEMKNLEELLQATYFKICSHGVFFWKDNLSCTWSCVDHIDYGFHRAALYFFFLRKKKVNTECGLSLFFPKIYLCQRKYNTMPCLLPEFGGNILKTRIKWTNFLTKPLTLLLVNHPKYAIKYIREFHFKVCSCDQHVVFFFTSAKRI